MNQTLYVSTDEICSLFPKAVSDAYQEEVPQYRTLLDPVSGINATALKEEGAPINYLTPRTPNIDAAQLEMPKRGMTAKNVIEGLPPRNCPILLRQTSFKALEEFVAFVGEGDIASGTHTARFGEIEQREMALTRKGRALYDFQSNLGGAEQNSYAANEARSAFEVALGAAVLVQIQLVEGAQTRSIAETLHQLAGGVAA